MPSGLNEEAERAPLKDASSAERHRLLALDAFRGLSLAAMIAFHATWDLDFFGLLPSGSLGAGFRAAGHAIAASFLIVVGASLALAGRGGLAIRPFLTRVAKIAAAAAAVTIATRLALPDEYIFFGILHCIVVVSLICAPLLGAPAALLWLLALACLLAPVALASPAFESPWIAWIGLGVSEPVTNDWAPVLPALGYALAGMTGMRMALNSPRFAALSRWRPSGPAARLAVASGRRSLTIYLLHQPIILALFYAGSFAAGRSPPSEATAFERSCDDQCVSRGSDGAFCQRVCGCIRAGAQPTGYWTHVMTNQLSSDERSAFDAVIGRCYAQDAPSGEENAPSSHPGP